MRLKNIIFLSIYFLISLAGFSEDISISSITNTCFYKLKNDEVEYKSNTVSANLELFELSTTIKSDKTKIRRGEIFKLNINIKNFSNYDTNNMITTLVLPQGFKYIENSAKTKENIISRIEQKGNKLLIYFENKLIKKESLDLYLSMKTSVSAIKRENYFFTFSKGELNRNDTIKSNTNSCKIILEEESFEKKATIYGRAFLDKNKNKVYDEGELPIPNLKIFMENGHFAVTDKDGKYSIFGERAITHIVRIAKETIPKDGKLEKIDSRYNETGDIAFADVKRNELYKINFAFINEDEKFVEEIKNRKKIAEKLMSEIEEISKEEFTFSSRVPGTIVETSGYFDTRMEDLSSMVQEFEKERQKKLLQKEEKKVERKKEEKLEKRLKKLENKLEILNLKDKQVVDSIISIEITSSLKHRTKLYVNGKEISEEFMGINGSFEDNDLAYYRYDGIELDREENEIKVVSNSKEKSIKVFYPSKIDKIDISYDKEKLVTNFVDPIDVKVKLLNKNGYVIKKPYFISLENSSGVWISPEDISKDDGLQFIIEDGEENLKLLPTVDKTIDLKAKVENKEEKISLNMMSLKEPTVLTGIIEGRLNFNSKNLNVFQDGLNKKIENDNRDFSYRTSVFSKGHLSDKYEFTLSYDNTKNDDDMYFQNIKRDNYYLVFGDNSIKGYEAQSKTKLYLSLIGENSTHLYGDYNVDYTKSDFNVGNYSRTLSGYKYNYDNQKLKLETFISRTSDIKKKDEIEARYTSGPYYLSNKPIQENSEKIEIVVYNKNNPNIIKEIVQPPEYTIDYNTGILYFNTLIPKYDKEGNPIYIRVEYEVEDSLGEKYYLYGGNISYKLNEIAKIGGGYFKDKNPENDYENKAVNFVLEKDEYGKLIVEKGKTEKDLVKGKATYIAYTNDKDKKLKSKISYYDSDEGFDNPDSSVKSNARLLLVNNRYVINENSEVEVEGFKYTDKKENISTEEIVMDYKKNISETSSLTVGGKYREVEGKEETEKIKTLGTKYEWKPFKINGLDSYLEYEQDINQKSKKRISLASEYKYLDRFKVYGKYDFINTVESTNIIGRYNDSYSKYIGFEYEKIFNMKPFVEFREMTNEERDKEIAFGFKSDYKYDEKLSFTGVFERVESIHGNKNPNSTNLLMSSIYKDGKEKIGVNSLDISDSNEVIAVLLKNSYGQKINDDFTFALKNRYFIKDIKTDVVRDRLLLGLAYRDTKDIYSSVLKYEMNYDDQLENSEYTHTSHIFNSINNYQLTSKDMFSFSVGGKYTIDKNEDTKGKYTRGLVDLNWKHFVGEKIDLGLNTAFTMDNSKNKFYAVGVEVGYKLDDYIWISLGYNFSGFKDRDFYEDDKYIKGGYLRFRVLLDESILNKF